MPAGAKVQVSSDGSAWSDATLTGLHWSINLIQAEGSKTYQVRVIDGLNNADANTASYAVTVDTVAPTVSVTSETSSNSTHTLAKAGDTITASFSSTDTVDSVTIGGHPVLAVSTGGTG